MKIHIDLRQVLIVIGLSMACSFLIVWWEENRKAKGETKRGPEVDWPIIDYPLSVHLPSHYTGTVTVGTNIIWPITRP